MRYNFRSFCLLASSLKTQTAGLLKKILMFFFGSPAVFFKENE